MGETRLQSKMAQKYSELFPNKRGQLFHVSNERNNKLQAIQARSIGIFPGVSDFIYFEPNFLRENVIFGTIMVGIEVKESGTRHSRDHIEQQLEWARILESQGGTWRLVRTVEELISCTQLDFKGLTIKDVEKMLENVKTKTIKF